MARNYTQIAPEWARSMVPQPLKDWILGTTRLDARQLPSIDRLRSLMKWYQVKDLIHADPPAFRARINEFLELQDAGMEGYVDSSKQRDISIKFCWAHDHDFGDFFVKGLMGERHISLIAALMDWFPVLPQSLEGKRILDVGCWTGGTSLVLTALGADVVAVEEVKKYIDCLSYLKFAFDVRRLDPRNLSLFECTIPDLQDSFDFILFAGVLYHVTDPVLALRIAYNCLKDGGSCIIETAVCYSEQHVLAYEGPRVHYQGTAENLNRTGWNWFLPSPSTLAQIMRDVGFVEIRMSRVVDSSGGGRVFAVGTRDYHRDMTRAGLSLRTIR